MRSEDVRAYLERDWQRVARHDRARWRDRRRRVGPSESFRIAGELYAHVRRVRPDWPSEESRRADHRDHLQLSERLRAVGSSHAAR